MGFKSRFSPSKQATANKVPETTDFIPVELLPYPSKMERSSRHILSGKSSPHHLHFPHLQDGLPWPLPTPSAHLLGWHGACSQVGWSLWRCQATMCFDGQPAEGGNCHLWWVKAISGASPCMPGLYTCSHLLTLQCQEKHTWARDKGRGERTFSEHQHLGVSLRVQTEPKETWTVRPRAISVSALEWFCLALDCVLKHNLW